MTEKKVQTVKSMLKKAYEAKTGIYTMSMAQRNTPIKGIQVTKNLVKLPTNNKQLKPQIKKNVKKTKKKDD